MQAIPVDTGVGQVGPDPEHDVAFTTMPDTHFAALHGVPELTNVSAGQAVLVPSHFSATSQNPAAGRHSLHEADGPQVPSLAAP
ncbi:MAG: hypothetical protein ACHREM_18570 [Polyangiales bacterium]